MTLPALFAIARAFVCVSGYSRRWYRRRKWVAESKATDTGRNSQHGASFFRRRWRARFLPPCLSSFLPSLLPFFLPWHVSRLLSPFVTLTSGESRHCRHSVARRRRIRVIIFTGENDDDDECFSLVMSRTGKPSRFRVQRPFLSGQITIKILVASWFPRNRKSV